VQSVDVICSLHWMTSLVSFAASEFL